MDAKLKCPRCGSADVKANGSSRFLCHGCVRTFSRSTSTVMSSRKLVPDKLRLMVNMMVNGCKLKAISDAVGISSRTAYVWRMKVCAVAFEIQKSAMLSGKVWIDEKLIPVNEGMLYRKTGGFKLNVAWIAFRSSINEANIEDKIDQLVSMRYQTKATFRVKDRYNLDN